MTRAEILREAAAKFVAEEAEGKPHLFLGALWAASRLNAMADACPDEPKEYRVVYETDKDFRGRPAGGWKEEEFRLHERANFRATSCWLDSPHYRNIRIQSRTPTGPWEEEKA